MTIEETISALDIVEHMESFSVLYEPGEPMNQTTVGKLKEACRMAISILRARTDPPPNDPLTLEELREMDGEPVWIESPCIPNGGRYIILSEFGITFEKWTSQKMFHCENYGNTWLAYRRKPEEVQQQ